MIDSPILPHDKYDNENSIYNKIRHKIGTNEVLTANYDNRYYKKHLSTAATNGTGTTNANFEIEKPALDLKQAIKLIQASERGRQGRLRAHLMIEMKKSEAFRAYRASTKGLDNQKLTNDAATIFQKIWRAKQARKLAKSKRNSELEFIGCKISTAQKDQLKLMKEKMDAISDKRAIMRLSNEEELNVALENLDLELKENEEDAMRTLMSDTIREWYLKEYEANGKLPEIPENGTNFLFDPKKAIDLENQKLEAEKAAAAAANNIKEEDPDDERVKGRDYEKSSME